MALILAFANMRNMERTRRLISFALLCVIGVPLLLAQDESALSDIHKRLSTPGYEARHDHDRMMFIGEIKALGPVFQGACKQAVGQSVDFSVSEILLGNPPEPTVHANYNNCTRVALPSPPFTLRSKVIVYCFRNMSKGFKCLAPVPFTDERLRTVRSWIAATGAARQLPAPKD